MTLDFAARTQLGDFSYDARLEAGNEIVVLFGHSGAGKSLTLQLIAGLLRPAEGRIVIGGEPVFDSRTGLDLPPQQRRLGYVVQDLALFPHMTVAENVAFGMTGGNRDRRLAEMLDLMHLGEFRERKPRSLSGGQQQRAALARALAREASLLLLDEPFSALDESLRVELRRELIRLRSELALSVIFVTHDLREAHLVADRLAVFDAGRLLQFDGRERVFRQPANRRVAELTGVANILRGRVTASEDGELAIEAGSVQLRAPTPNGWRPQKGETVDIAIRAERVNLRRLDADAPGQPNLIRATIREELAYGATHTLRFESALGEPVEVEIAARPYEVLGVAAQKSWTLELPPGDLHVMPVSSESPEGSGSASAITA